ncbi:MAG: hypothetical protein RL441_1391 [Actinomycetota bacterium]
MSQDPNWSSASYASDLGDFPGVHMAVDVAVMTVGEPDEKGRRHLMTLLTRRPEGFQAGTWVLPGRFVRFRERLKDAAVICLKEKAGITGYSPRQMMVLDNPDRDPRGWTMSVGHVVPVPFYVALKAVGESPMTRDLAVVTDRRIEFKTSQQSLPMEQQRVINYAVDYLRTRYASRPDPKGFLGPVFTLSELYEVHAAILGEAYWSRDAMRRNFVPFLEDTGELAKGSVGKPAALYRHRARDPLTTPRRVQRPSSSQIAP